MDLNLKSVLKDPRLNLGARAGLLALSLSLLPFWVSVIIAVILFLSTYGLNLNLIYSFFSFLYIVSVLSGFASPLIVFVFALIVSYLILAFSAKEVLIRNRPLWLGGFSLLLLSVLDLGFFSQAVNIFIFVLITALIVRDLLSEATVFPKKVLTLSAIIAFLSAEISWSVLYLGLNPYLSSLIVVLATIASTNLVFEHLRGSLVRRQAVFWSSAVLIVTLMLTVIFAFKF